MRLDLKLLSLVKMLIKLSYEHAIANGAVQVKEPKCKPWGQEVTYVRDLNGINVEICSPMS